jgi:hypothetical protein
MAVLKVVRGEAWLIRVYDFLFLIGADRKGTKTTNKTSCPSPNIQNWVTFVERGVAVK